QLALHQDHPTGIAVYGTQVYWANEGDGTIVGCTVDACADADRSMLVSGLSKPRALAVDEKTLYWVDAGSDGMHLSVSSCPRSGCADAKPKALLTAEAAGNGLAVDEEHLYVGAWDALLRC